MNDYPPQELIDAHTEDARALLLQDTKNHHGSCMKELEFHSVEKDDLNQSLFE